MVNDSTDRNNGPIERLIRYCALNPLLTLLIITAAAFWGYRSLANTPLDAIPDLSDVQVIIYTEWQGRKPGSGGRPDHLSAHNHIAGGTRR